MNCQTYVLNFTEMQKQSASTNNSHLVVIITNVSIRD